MKNLTNTMILWTPNTDQIALSPHPPVNHEYTDKFRMSWGACNFPIAKMDFKNRELEVLTVALQVIIRDKIPADKVHKILSELEEYNVNTTKEFF